MSDPEVIYLQPECCADPAVGRLWCEGDAPADCEDGKQWTKYVRAERDSVTRGMALLGEAKTLVDETLRLVQGQRDDIASAAAAYAQQTAEVERLQAKVVRLLAALRRAQDCIYKLSDGPARAAWGETLDEIDAVLAETD
jgi:hypothetical protein